MKTEIKVAVRAYPVTVKDTRSGEVQGDTIVLEKSRLQAGVMFDLGAEDIIYRIYNRRGYRVLEVGKPRKLELVLDLEELYTKHTRMEQLQAFGKEHTGMQQEQEAGTSDK